MNRIGTKLTLRSKVDGRVFEEDFICECGGAVYYDEHDDAVCIKCGLIW